MKHLLILSFVSLFTCKVAGQPIIPALEAVNHVGESVRVYGSVLSVKFDKNSNTVTLVLGPYPSAVNRLTVIATNVTKDKDRNLLMFLSGKDISLKGKVESDKNHVTIKSKASELKIRIDKRIDQV